MPVLEALVHEHVTFLRVQDGVHWIEIEYGPDGAPRTAELAINIANPFRRDTLIYNPGYALPKDIPGEIVNHRIDSDWYYIWEDWN